MQYKANGAFTRTLMFLHDEKGAIVGVGVKNAGDARFTNYYYAKNLQGDVAAIYRSDYTEAKGYYPTLVASYEYDPWGKVTSVKGSSGAILSLEAYPNHIAHVNPIRYRGYYYDNETGFYYLQSRYYDPAISRFINADSYGSTGQAFLGTNMFAYCNNNPVLGVDPDGRIVMINPDIVLNSVKKVAEIANKIWEGVKKRVGSAWNLVSNTVAHVWNRTKHAVISTVKWVQSTVKNAESAINDFVIDRFSTPEKAKNTFSAVAWTLDSAAAYCGGVAAGLSIPTFGMSTIAAGTSAAILLLVSMPFHGAALIIDIFNEE